MQLDQQWNMDQMLYIVQKVNNLILILFKTRNTRDNLETLCEWRY